jgi:large subunit ribosomal protein L5
MRLHAYFKYIIYSDLIWKQNLKNPFQVEKAKKMVLNTTSKSVVNDKKLLVPSLLALELITGQKLKWGIAKKSIAGFKLRKEQIISCKVTLKGKTMYSFMERILDFLLPTFREFEGIKKESIDLNGNLNIGIPLLLVFPELENHFETFETIRGFDLTVVTSIQTNVTNSLVWSGLGFPEKKKK